MYCPCNILFLSMEERRKCTQKSLDSSSKCLPVTMCNCSCTLFNVLRTHLLLRLSNRRYCVGLGHCFICTMYSPLYCRKRVCHESAAQMETLLHWSCVRKHKELDHKNDDAMSDPVAFMTPTCSLFNNKQVKHLSIWMIVSFDPKRKPDVRLFSLWKLGML